MPDAATDSILEAALVEFERHGIRKVALGIRAFATKHFLPSLPLALRADPGEALR